MSIPIPGNPDAQLPCQFRDPGSDGSGCTDIVEPPEDFTAANACDATKAGSMCVDQGGICGCS